MQMTYDRLNTDELRGTTQTDYLVSSDAHPRVVDGLVTATTSLGFPWLSPLGAC